MKIQINTDHNIDGHEQRAEEAESVVESALGHYARQITRVEVHLSDENSHKSGAANKRCLMEARLEGHQPIAVTDQAATIEQAIEVAAGKLKSALEHALGRLSSH